MKMKEALLIISSALDSLVEFVFDDAPQSLLKEVYLRETPC